MTPSMYWGEADFVRAVIIDHNYIFAPYGGIILSYVSEVPGSSAPLSELNNEDIQVCLWTVACTSNMAATQARVTCGCDSANMACVPASSHH